MRLEILMTSRQFGKARLLAEKVAEFQDAGHDPVVVVVPDASYVDEWYDLLFEVGVDPSRIILHPACNASDITEKGAYLVQDGDRMSNLHGILQNVSKLTTTDVITITTNQDLGDIR